MRDFLDIARIQRSSSENIIFLTTLSSVIVIACTMSLDLCRLGIHLNDCLLYLHIVFYFSNSVTAWAEFAFPALATNFLNLCLLVGSTERFVWPCVL